MKDKALFIFVAIILFSAGFVAGLAVGRRQGPRLSPTDRLAQKLLEDADHSQPIDAKRMTNADAISKSLLKTLDRELRKRSDEDHGREE